MPDKSGIWIILFVTVLTLGGCSGRTQQSDVASTEKQDYTGDACRWTDSLISAMTVEQRIGQLFMPAVYAFPDEATLASVAEYAAKDFVGGIILLKGDSRGARSIADTLRKISPDPGMWIAIDAETGLAMRLSDAPAIPSAYTLGKTADDQKVYEYGRFLARHCRDVGVNMVLGPVLDVESSPGGFIGRRSFGGDPAKVGCLGVAYARGLEDGGIVSVAKHFPGHGCADEDSHKDLAIIAKPLSYLQKYALPPFREYISAGLSSVMVGHLAVTAIDPQMRSAALSEAVITDLLRNDMGFKGLVLTDALNMKGARKGSGKNIDPSVAAILAGADMILAPPDLRTGIEAVKQAFEAGIMTDSLLNDRLRHILLCKYRFLRN